MKVFVISQKATLNSEKGYCPLWTEHRYGNSERKAIFYFCHEELNCSCCLIKKLYHITNKKEWRKCEYEKEKV
jgi:hypothetical protein